MRKASGILFFVLMFVAGCTSLEQTSERVSIQAQVPESTRSAVITAAPMKPGTIKNVKGLYDAPQLFARDLRDALVPKRPGWQIKLAEEAAPTPDADVTITTELLEIDGGSAAMRFWVGFGSGATVSRVKVSIVDKAGKLLATSEISERTTCPLGVCTEENEPAVRANLKSLAIGVAEFVTNPAEYEKKRESR
jgi:hypothetical protein